MKPNTVPAWRRSHGFGLLFLTFVCLQVSAAPALQISRARDRVVLSWPVAAGCLSLYSTPQLSPPTWTLVAEPIVVARDQNTVTLLPLESSRYFSLRCEEINVPVEIAAQVAEHHARTLWTERRAARGEPIPISGPNGAPFSYLVPFRLNSSSFPDSSAILETVASLKAQFGPFADDGPETLPEEFYVSLEDALGSMGFIHVSASKENYPVLLAQNSLPPYYLFQQSARSRALRALDSRFADLIGYFMPGPHQEYFAFSAGRKEVFVHARTLETITPEQFAALPACSVPRELAADRDRAWAENLDLARMSGSEAPPQTRRDENDIEALFSSRSMPPRALLRDSLNGEKTGLSTSDFRFKESSGSQLKWIADYALIPIVDWTYWCVPTAFTMAACFYDNHNPATGTKIRGWGRIVDYWLENGTGHNVPNFIDELIDPSLSPPSWRTGGLLGVLNDPGWNRYAFTLMNVTGNAANDWAWAELVKELNAARPAVWGNGPEDNTTGHAMTAFGYRVTGGQRFVIVYNTWGATPQQQYAEYNYNQWIFGGASSGTGFAQIIPGGGDGSEDVTLLSPRGGEVVFGPGQIQWRIEGNTIRSTQLFDSIDAGKTWVQRGSISTPGAGVYTQPWTPPAATSKGRVRIRGIDAAGGLVAGDGSVKNVFFQALPDLEPVRGANGYCNLRDGKLIVVVANRGPVEALASSTEVKFFNASGQLTVQLPTPVIPGNGSAEAVFDIPSACWNPDCDFEIRVDALNQVNEANESNNAASGACGG